MQATIIKWFSETKRQSAFGFAKPHGVVSQDLLVYPNAVIAGVPYEGALIDCRSVKSARGLRAIDVRVLR